MKIKLFATFLITLMSGRMQAADAAWKIKQTLGEFNTRVDDLQSSEREAVGYVPGSFEAFKIVSNESKNIATEFLAYFKAQTEGSIETFEAYDWAGVKAKLENFLTSKKSYLKHKSQGNDLTSQGYLDPKYKPHVAEKQREIFLDAGTAFEAAAKEIVSTQDYLNDLMGLDPSLSKRILELEEQASTPDYFNVSSVGTPKFKESKEYLQKMIKVITGDHLDITLNQDEMNFLALPVGIELVVQGLSLGQIYRIQKVITSLSLEKDLAKKLSVVLEEALGKAELALSVATFDSLIKNNSNLSRAIESSSGKTFIQLALRAKELSEKYGSIESLKPQVDLFNQQMAKAIEWVEAGDRFVDNKSALDVFAATPEPVAPVVIEPEHTPEELFRQFVFALPTMKWELNGKEIPFRAVAPKLKSRNIEMLSVLANFLKEVSVKNDGFAESFETNKRSWVASLAGISKTDFAEPGKDWLGEIRSNQIDEFKKILRLFLSEVKISK